MTGIWLETERACLRPLTRSDVTARYLGWLHAQAGGAIMAARSDMTLADLEAYVSARVNRDDLLFLGIFERTTGTHIGNLKFEPIDRGAREAVMGILVGDPAWRGVGLVPEVLPATSDKLCRERGLDRVSLGVKRDHVAALRAYERSGFRIGSSSLIASGDGHYVMIRTAAC